MTTDTMFKTNTIDYDNIHRRISDRTALVCVLGLGYVGLPLLLNLHDHGFNVLGYDIDADKIAKLQAGKSYIKDLNDTAIAKLNQSGRFMGSANPSDLANADAILICVPTPLTKNREPEMSFVTATCQSIASHLRPGQLVVLESTTYPGTTNDLVLPILEQANLKLGEQYFLAYAPEREDPGNPDYSCHTIPKVVGADDDKSLSLACELYKRITPEVVPVSSASTAEAVKLTENIFRSVNIALVNELKVVYHQMGIDIWEVIEAAKTKPFGYMPFYPGPGLGGHCIPIDPFYLTWKAREYGLPTRFVELSGEINTAMPGYVIKRIRQELDRCFSMGLNGAKILIIGMAYKQDIDDIRESPALVIMEKLRQKGSIVEYHDPFVPEIPETREHAKLTGIKSINLEAADLASYHAIVICTKHTQIDYDRISNEAKLIIDTRNAMIDYPKGNVTKA